MLLSLLCGWVTFNNPFSSSSSLSIARLTCSSPSALHTSAATNHGSPFDRPPHSKIKNRNRLFLSETVSGTGWGARDFRLMRHTISGLKPALRGSIRGYGWSVWKSGFKTRKPQRAELLETKRTSGKKGGSAKQTETDASENKQTQAEASKAKQTEANASKTAIYKNKNMNKNKNKSSSSYVPPTPCDDLTADESKRQIGRTNRKQTKNKPITKRQQTRNKRRTNQKQTKNKTARRKRERKR